MSSGAKRDFQAALNRNGEIVQLLTFKVDDREYALDLASVVQIVRMVAVNRVPQMPDSVEGVFNLRGTSIPVIDVRRVCGLPAKPLEQSALLVIARGNGRILALTADSISDVLTVPASSIELRESSTPEMVYGCAIGKLVDRAVFILDPGILSSR